MRNLLAFAFALLLGGALVYVSSRGLPQGLLTTTEEAPPTRSSDAPARTPTPVPERRPSAPPAEPEAAPLPAELSGTLVVLDEGGVEQGGEDGILSLGLGIAGARTQRDVEVRGGRWSVALDPALPG